MLRGVAAKARSMKQHTGAGRRQYRPRADTAYPRRAQISFDALSRKGPVQRKPVQNRRAVP